MSIGVEWAVREQIAVAALDLGRLDQAEVSLWLVLVNTPFPSELTIRHLLPWSTSGTDRDPPEKVS